MLADVIFGTAELFNVLDHLLLEPVAVQRDADGFDVFANASLDRFGASLFVGFDSIFQAFDFVDAFQQVGDQNRPFLLPERFNMVQGLFDGFHQRMVFLVGECRGFSLHHVGQAQDHLQQGGIDRFSTPGHILSVGQCH